MPQAESEAPVAIVDAVPRLDRLLLFTGHLWVGFLGRKRDAQRPGPAPAPHLKQAADLAEHFNAAAQVSDPIVVRRALSPKPRYKVNSATRSRRQKTPRRITRMRRCTPLSTSISRTTPVPL